MLLVHHSRNTAQKQWDETLVLALGGIVKVFKSFINTLYELPDFEKSWCVLLEHLESFILSGSREVSGTTIQLLHDFLLTNGEKLPRPLWEASMVMWEKLVTVLTRNPENGKTLTILAETICDLFLRLRSRFSSSDIIRVIRMVRLLALFQTEIDQELSPMQKSVMKLYSNISPLSEEAIPTVFFNLLIFVAAAIGYPYKPPLPDQQDPEQLNSSGLLFTPSLSYHCLADSALARIVELYKIIPQPISALIFEDLAKVIGAVMMTKYQTYLLPLWKSAVPAFISIVSTGLPALNRSEIVKDRTRLIIIWTDVADTLEDFLLHDRTTLPKLSPDALKEDEELDVVLADCIAQNMLSGAAHAELLHERLLDILRSGTLQVTANREFFAQACYKNLFYLCSRGGEQDDAHSCHLVIARLAAPLLLLRCKEVLQAFVTDDRQTGQCPLPRCRLAEISFLLQELYNLELHPALEVLPEQTSQITSKMTGTKRHLLHLFPLLCDCITTREESIKERLKAIFHEMAKSLGLES